MAERRVPRIRFKGFEEDWEQRKLSDVADKVIEKNTDLAVQETFTNSAEYGVISQRDFFDHDISNAENIGGYYVVRDEDFVYNPRISVTAPVGPVNRNKLGRNGIMSPLYTVFRTHGIDTTYLEWFFKSSYWHPFMYFNGDSGTRSDRFSIKDAVFFEMSIPTPSFEEQRQIGVCLDQLDNLITLHQRKLEKLKILKKAMLEKMFPKNGTKVPEIRFSGFTEDWEQRKFSELYEKVSRKNDLTYGKDDIISVANMYFKEDSYITDESYLLTYNIFELGDIAFEGNKSKNYAHGRFVENTIGNGIVSHVFDVFKPIMKPYDLQFWKYAINNEQLMGGILLRSTKASTMMTNLVANDFLQETILIPTYPEQQKIGDFFQELDHLISLHQRKLEILRQIKKSMLERMFV